MRGIGNRASLVKDAHLHHGGFIVLDLEGKSFAVPDREKTIVRDVFRGEGHRRFLVAAFYVVYGYSNVGIDAVSGVGVVGLRQARAAENANGESGWHARLAIVPARGLLEVDEFGRFQNIPATGIFPKSTVVQKQRRVDGLEVERDELGSHRPRQNGGIIARVDAAPCRIRPGHVGLVVDHPFLAVGALAHPADFGFRKGMHVVRRIGETRVPVPELCAVKERQACQGGADLLQCCLLLLGLSGHLAHDYGRWCTEIRVSVVEIVEFRWSSPFDHNHSAQAKSSKAVKICQITVLKIVVSFFPIGARIFLFHQTTRLTLRGMAI